MKHRHWTELPESERENTVYGFHWFGIGVYRFEPGTYKILECWPDYESCHDDELEKYYQWCKEKGLEPCERPKSVIA